MSETEKKKKKSILKKWWFWVIVVLIIIAIGGNSNNSSPTSSNTVAQENRKEVTIIDFSTMSFEDIKSWCDTNNLQCSKKEDYSDNVAKGNFINQNIIANTVVHEGDKILITYSLGKEPSTEEKNALKKAESYASTMHMSKAGIYKQLTSEYGEGFTTEAAQYAIDNLEFDWKSNALKKAKDYQNTMNMSKSAIYKQLTSSYGEGFTEEEAQYAIDNLE